MEIVLGTQQQLQQQAFLKATGTMQTKQNNSFSLMNPITTHYLKVAGK